MIKGGLVGGDRVGVLIGGNERQEGAIAKFRLAPQFRRQLPMDSQALLCQLTHQGRCPQPIAQPTITVAARLLGFRDAIQQQRFHPLFRQFIGEGRPGNSTTNHNPVVMLAHRRS